MGIGTGILNTLGQSLDSQYRREFKWLARTIFAEAPIGTVEELYGMFGHGGAIEALVAQGLSRKDAEGGAQEVEFEVRQMFRSAKVDGPGSPSDRSARAMATKIAEATAKRGPVVFVVGWTEVFKEVQKRKYITTGIDQLKLLEDGILNAVQRSPYLKDKYAEMG